MAVKRSAGTSGAFCMAIRAVGIGRVADDDDTDVGGGVLVDGLTLGDEDWAVGAEKVFAFHAGGTGAGADEEGPVSPGEGCVRLVGQNCTGEEGEGAVVQLHSHAFERAHRGRDLQQLEDDRLIGAEEVAIGDAKDESIADIAGGASNCYTNGVIHQSKVSRCGRGDFRLACLH